MASYLDLSIFICFIVINTIVGVFAGKTNYTINDYALGDRKFSVGAIAGTLIATWIGAGFFLFSLSKIYTSGFPFIIIMAANGLMLLLLSIFYIPRMKNFLGSLSIATAMGNFYGQHVRIITAISAICLAVGYVGLQIKVLSNLVSWMTGSEGVYVVFLCSGIVTFYAAFGGIRAVVYTDLVQFFTFGVFVPIIAFMLWNSLDNTTLVSNVIFSSEFLDYDYLFSFSWLSIFIWFILPAMDPSIFQRILMARDIQQASQAFFIASIACVTIILFSAWLAVLVRATGQSVDPDNIINYILHNYSYKGLIGLTASGIAAMVMSTVDSYINTSAVLFSEDICKPFGIQLKNELTVAKIFSVLAGIFGVFIALSGSNLFDITLLIANFYVPIVTAPITLAIFGFRSTPKAALIGIFGGVSTVIIWRMFFQNTGIDSVVPGLIANFMLLLSSHYLLRQQGGWVKVTDDEHLRKIRYYRTKFYRTISGGIRWVNIKDYLLQQAPKKEKLYLSFGLFSLVSNLASMYFLSDTGDYLVLFIYQSVLTISVMCITYPIWPNTIKKSAIFSIFYPLLCVYTLVIAGTYMLLLSSFGSIQLITFMANLLVIAILFEWRFAIIAMVIGICIGAKIYILQCGSIDGNMGTIQFQILYVLLVISAALIAFAKPKELQIKYLEKLNFDLVEQHNKKTYDLVRALHHKEEFIDRFDEDCIQIFQQMGNRINDLCDKLLNKQTNAQELQIIATQIKIIIERLKGGSDYLNSLIKSLKQIKLNSSNADLYQIIEQSVRRFPIVIESFSTMIPVICDRDQILRCCTAVVNYLEKNANGKISILISNDFLEYDLSFSDQYKEKVKAYKITFVVNCNTLSKRDLHNLLNPQLDNSNEILFAEIANIVDAHYGSFVIEANDNVNLQYVITIPVDVKAVRPKAVDLADDSARNITKLYKLLHRYEKHTLTKIGLALYKEGLDVDKIAHITNLSQEEVEEFKTL